MTTSRRKHLEARESKARHKLLSPKYQSQSSLGEYNRSSSSPKRVYFVNTITVIRKEDESREIDAMKSDASKDMGRNIIIEVDKKAEKGLESFETVIKEEETEEEEEDDSEYFDTFPTVEELGYHEWILKIPRPAWLHYHWIMSKGLESRKKPSNPIKISNFVGRVRGLKVFVVNFTYECDFIVLEDTTSIIYYHLGELVFGKPFVRKTRLVYDKEKGTMMFERDNEKITFKMPYKMERFNHIDFEGIKTGCIPPFVLENDDDHEKTYYSDNLILGPEYKQEESVSKEIQNLMKLKSRANSEGGEITNMNCVQKCFQENECEIFTVSGDGVRIFPDGVTSPDL
ncbi:hypothetical protein Tco_0228309 [Tanacetum coccineum]